MIQHIKKLFLGMIVLTCFTCFQRADYNLPLFAFSFFLWDYKHPNVHHPWLSCKKLGFFTCSFSLGLLTLSGWSTGESLGAQMTISTTDRQVHHHSYWPCQSLPSSLRYFLAYAVGYHHYTLPFRPGMQDHHQEHCAEYQVYLQPSDRKDRGRRLMIT